MKEITAYKCDHCGKVFQRKGTAQNHEAKCFRNPTMRACVMCKFFIPDEISIGRCGHESNGELLFDETEFERNCQDAAWSNKDPWNDYEIPYLNLRANCPEWQPTANGKPNKPDPSDWYDPDHRPSTLYP